MPVHVYGVVHYHHPYTSLHPLRAPNKTDRREAVTWPPVRGLRLRGVGSEAPVGYEVPFTERRGRAVCYYCALHLRQSRTTHLPLRVGEPDEGSVALSRSYDKRAVALFLSGSWALRMNFREPNRLTSENSTSTHSGE